MNQTQMSGTAVIVVVRIETFEWGGVDPMIGSVESGLIRNALTLA